MGQSRRTFTDEFKAAAVGRLFKPGATQTGVAKELGVMSSQLKTWRLEIEAAGSMISPGRWLAQSEEIFNTASLDGRCFDAAFSYLLASLRLGHDHGEHLEAYSSG